RLCEPPLNDFTLLCIRLPAAGIDLAQGDALLPSNASARLILWRERGRLPFLPAELALDGAPGGDHGTRPPLQLVPVDRITADAERTRLAEEDVLQGRQRFLRRQHAQQYAGPVLLHENGRREHVQRPGGEQQVVAVADHLRRQVVK